jgi:hypothetical protein
MMALIGRYRATHQRRFAVGTVDALARALATGGPQAPPVGELECVVLRQVDPVTRDFTPPLTLGVHRTTKGFLIFDGSYRIEGQATGPRPLANGKYRAAVRGPYYRPSEFELQWPPAALRTPLVLPAPIDPALQQPVDLELLPSAAYPYPDLTTLRFNLGPTLIRGTFLTTAGDAIEGAQVSVTGLVLNPAVPPWPFLDTETGASGDWAILLPDRRRIGYPNETAPPAAVALNIRVTRGATVVNYPPVPVTLGRENHVPNTGLRGQVTGAGGRPFPGATITTSLGPERSITRANGQWFLYFDPNRPGATNASVTATAPDGRAATVTGVTLVSKATVVVPSIHIA